MALARNLKPNRLPKIRSQAKGKKDYRKITLYGFFLFVFIFGAYGVFNLVKLAPSEEEKKDLVLDTGNRPLPEEIKIWIDVPGGLNMRSEPNTASEILVVIPDKTELTALELAGDWYKVSYKNKIGWVHKDYVKTFQEVTTVDADDWKEFKNSSYGYTIFYPGDWVSMDYGSNEAANLLSYVGFGLQLSNNLDPAVLPPVVLKITTDPKNTVDQNYKKKRDVKEAQVSIANQKGTQYIYTANSGVQMTTYVFSSNDKTYILEESGGYRGELDNMIKKIKV
jgi:hypothetical protein